MPHVDLFIIYLFIMKLVPRYTKKKKEKNTRKTQTIENIQKEIQKTHITKKTHHMVHI